MRADLRAPLRPGSVHLDNNKSPSTRSTRPWNECVRPGPQRVLGLADETGGYRIRPGELWDEKQKCWYNVITLATSTNGGATSRTRRRRTTTWRASHTDTGRGPGRAASSARATSNTGRDGYYYSVVHVEGRGVQPTGACLWRTRDLSDAKSWRAWVGPGSPSGSSIPTSTTSRDPAQHVCALGRTRHGPDGVSVPHLEHVFQEVAVGAHDGWQETGFGLLHVHLRRPDQLVGREADDERRAPVVPHLRGA